jgi:DNA segregation ATPase FtsK/SpoIIIE-like protein
LADCLGINYSNISLHDSSGDVELTKRCFEQIIIEGLYSLPKETDITMSLHVESPDDLRYEIRKNGELIDELSLTGIYGVSKKALNAARQELIKKWSEENNDEWSELIQIYKKSPKIKTAEDFRDEIERTKPNKYVRKVFDEQAPSRDKIQEELEQEAEQEISSWMFWTLNKKRKEYVETRLESYYQQRVNAYNQRAAQHDDAENKAEVEFNQQSQRRCEERKQRLESLMKGNDIEVLQKEILRVPDVMSLPFQYHADARLDGTAINIYLSLPRPHDLPHLEGVRLASGNYKIKEIPDKNKKKDYSEWIWGIAVYVASNYFNVSPLINLVTIKGHVSIDSDDQFLYDITFDRNTFGSLDFENIDIEQVLSNFSVNDKLSKEVLDKLFALKEPEPRKEAKSAPNNMHDSLFNDAARLIVQEQNGSAALIQRKFQIGYKRAGAIMEQLEKAGIVGIAHGSNPRDVLISNEQELEDIISEL